MLIEYVTMNAIALRKILKKYDKVSMNASILLILFNVWVVKFFPGKKKKDAAITNHEQVSGRSRFHTLQTQLWLALALLTACVQSKQLIFVFSELFSIESNVYTFLVGIDGRNPKSTKFRPKGLFFVFSNTKLIDIYLLKTVH